MNKDFDAWNSVKKGVNQRVEILYFKEGEIWWINFGLNVGFEIDGKEAVAVLSQIKNIDSRRLVNKVGFLEKEVLKSVKEKTSQVNFG